MGAEKIQQLVMGAENRAKFLLTAAAYIIMATTLQFSTYTATLL